MNIDSITNIIEFPLKVLSWVADHFAPILVFSGCVALVFYTFRYRFKIVEWINKVRGIIPKKEKKENYWDKWLMKGSKLEHE